MRFANDSLRRVLTALCVAALTVSIPVGCGGPERAPRQPISGVDRPVEPAPDEDSGGTSMNSRSDSNPSATRPTGPESDAPANPPSASNDVPPRGDDERTRSATDLEAFIAEIAKQARGDGFVAIFWPISPRPLDQAGVASANGKYVNRLGERLAEQVSTGLQAEGIKTLAGAELINDLLAANRSLANFCELSDVFWLGERVGAPYVVYGTTQVVNYEALRQDRVLELRLWAKHLPTNRTIAVLQRDYREGRTAQQYYKDYVLPSQVPICADAPAARPSLESELDMTTRLVASRVAAKVGSAMAGKVAYFEPLETPAARTAVQDLAALQDAFLRGFAGAGSDLSKGPARIVNQNYATWGDALDEIGRRRRQFEASSSGSKSREWAANIENVLKQAGVEFISGLEDGDADALLRRVRAEAFRARVDEAIDEKTLAFLQASGSAFLVRSSLLPGVETWKLRLRVFDLNNGRKIADESEALPASLSTALEGSLR